MYSLNWRYLQLKCTYLQFNWRYIQFNWRYLQINWRYLQWSRFEDICNWIADVHFNWRYLQIRPIWRYLQLKCTYPQFNCRYLQIGLIVDISNWFGDIFNWIGDISNWIAECALQLEISSIQWINETACHSNPGYLYPGPCTALSKSQLYKQANTHHFTILQSELGLPSIGSWLPSGLSSTWRWAERRPYPRAHFFQLKICKKTGLLCENRESGKALKSVSLCPKAVVLTPMTLLRSTTRSEAVYSPPFNLCRKEGLFPFYKRPGSIDTVNPSAKSYSTCNWNLARRCFSGSKARSPVSTQFLCSCCWVFA